MANFHNPYMSSPDFGAGISGTMQDYMMQMLMKKLMGGQPQQSMGQSPLPRDNQMGAVQANPQSPTMGAGPQFMPQGQPPMGQGGGTDQAIAALLQYLQGQGQRGGGMGGRF